MTEPTRDRARLRVQNRGLPGRLAIQATMEVPGWCTAHPRCEVHGQMLSDTAAMIRFRVPSPAPEGAPTREALWFVTSEPRGLLDPWREEPWVDGGVAMAPVRRWRPWWCEDGLWMGGAGETTSSDASSWMRARWTEDGLSQAATSGTSVGCREITFDALAGATIAQNGM